MQRNQVALGVILSGVAGVVGAPLTWITVSSGIFTVSKAGMEGDGQVSIVAGVLIVICGVRLLSASSRPARVFAILFGLAMAGLAYWDYKDAQDTFAGSGVRMSPGIGLILTGLGGAAAGVLGFMLKPDPVMTPGNLPVPLPPPPPPPPPSVD